MRMEAMSVTLRNSFLNQSSSNTQTGVKHAVEGKNTELWQLTQHIRRCRLRQGTYTEPPISLWCVYQYNDYQDEDFYTLWGLFTSLDQARAARDHAIWEFKQRDFIRALPYVPVFRRSPSVRVAQGVWDGRENTNFFICKEIRVVDRLQCAKYQGEETLLEKYSLEFQDIANTVLELHNAISEETFFSWLPIETVLNILGVLSQCSEYRIPSGDVHIIMHSFFGGQAGSQTCGMIDVYGNKKAAMRKLRELRSDSRNTAEHWFDLHTLTLDQIGQPQTDIVTIA